MKKKIIVFVVDWKCTFFFVGLFVLLLSCSKSKTVPTEDKEPVKEGKAFTVMTYNIYGARSGGIPNLQVIADVINRVKPDLVALQEVDRFTTRNGKNVDIAKELGALTDMDYFFAKAEDMYGGDYGDAVLSKLPIKEKKAYNLSVTPELGGERRSVARILVEVDGKEIYFISTHLDHLSSEANRIRQAHELVDLVKGFGKPMITAGDFNAKPDSETISILRNYFTLGCKNNNCNQFTFSTNNPDRVIDYIMYAPLNAFSVANYSTYTWANKESDHFPVIATIQLSNE